MDSLAESQCSACRGDEPPLSDTERDELLTQVPGWSVVDRAGHPALERSFRFAGFKPGLDFTAGVAAAAEEAGHHPQIVTEWGKVTVRWWTHKIRGLHRNDFIMADRTDAIYESMPEALRRSPSR